MNIIIEVLISIIVIVFVLLVLLCKMGCYIVQRRHDQYQRQVNIINNKLKIINDMKREILKDN